MQKIVICLKAAPRRLNTKRCILLLRLLRNKKICLFLPLKILPTKKLILCNKIRLSFVLSLRKNETALKVCSVCTDGKMKREYFFTRRPIMKKTIQKMALTFVIVAMLLGPAFGAPQQPPEPQRSNDFRINVVTDKNAYVTGRQLSLVVELLNNSPLATRIQLPQSDPSTQAQQGDPNLPIIIGLARLIPLRSMRSPAGDQVDVEALDGPQAVKQVPLRLLGGRLLPGHSTVVISLANMKLVRRRPNNDGPQAQPQIMPLKPGLYLLDCTINKIAGVQQTHAEKIIKILPPPHDNGRRPPQANKPKR